MKKYKVSRLDLSFYLIGSLIFVAIGLLIVTGVIGPNEDAAEIDRIGGIVIGWLTILFFGGISLISLRFLFMKDETVIIMDETGFYDKRVCVKPIPWTEIRKARVFSGKTLYAFPQKFISLDVTNPDEYLKKKSYPCLSSLFKLLKLLYDEPGITISTSILGQSTETILSAIEEESRSVVTIEY